MAVVRSPNTPIKPVERTAGVLVCQRLLACRSSCVVAPPRTLVVGLHRSHMASTRKMPVRINEKKRTTFAGEHLVPSLSDAPAAEFVSVKSGRPYVRGSVVYLGRDVTPEMMLERYCEVAPSPADRTSALRRLAAYCDALHSVKIGNVLSVSYSADGLPELHVEEKCFLPEQQRKLP